MQKERRINFVWLGIALAAADWLLETALHTYLLGSGTFASNFLPHDANELWMRLVIIGLIIGAGGLAEYYARHQAELREHAERLNRLLTFLSEVNQHVQRKRNSEDLFAGICRAAVELGGLRFAWVGLINPQGSGLICAAKSACDEACRKAVEDAGVEAAVTCSMVAEAVREGRPAYCQVLADINCQAAWREPLLQHGAKSAASFPIRQEENAIGALCVYAGDSGFFHEEEIHILAEAADDISFALTAIAHEKQRKADEAALKARLEELERFHKATVDREFRLKELRDEVAALKAEIERLKGGAKP